MINFNLKCAEGHQFDSWFQSGAAFDKLYAAGHVSCAVCGSAKVEKALMAPRVATSEAKPENTAPPAQPLSAPRSPAEQALAELRKHVESTSDYVGNNFAKEARAMHLGEQKSRAIWGEAKPEDARKLIEDGIPVAPLPFTPSRKSN